MGKHQFGAYKRKRKAQEQNLINKSNNGGMDKFVTKKHRMCHLVISRENAKTLRFFSLC